MAALHTSGGCVSSRGPDGSQPPPSAAEGAAHEFLLFHCNHVSEDGCRCQQPLDEGWVTACSHVFCGGHAKAWFRTHDDCPCCRNGPVKLVRLDVSRAGVRRRGRTALLGLTPPEIVRSTEVALNFWLDQKLFELTSECRQQATQKDRHRLLEEVVRTRLGEAERAARSLEAEHQNLKRRLSESGSEMRHLEAELALIHADLKDATTADGADAGQQQTRPSFPCFSQNVGQSRPGSNGPLFRPSKNEEPAERIRSGCATDGTTPKTMQDSGKGLGGIHAAPPIFSGRATSFLMSGSRPSRRRIT